VLFWNNCENTSRINGEGSTPTATRCTPRSRPTTERPGGATAKSTAIRSATSRRPTGDAAPPILTRPRPGMARSSWSPVRTRQALILRVDPECWSKPLRKTIFLRGWTAGRLQVLRPRSLVARPHQGPRLVDHPPGRAPRCSTSAVPTKGRDGPPGISRSGGKPAGGEVPLAAGSKASARPGDRMIQPTTTRARKVLFVLPIAAGAGFQTANRGERTMARARSALDLEKQRCQSSSTAGPRDSCVTDKTAPESAICAPFTAQPRTPQDACRVGAGPGRPPRQP